MINPILFSLSRFIELYHCVSVVRDLQVKDQREFRSRGITRTLMFDPDFDHLRSGRRILIFRVWNFKYFSRVSHWYSCKLILRRLLFPHNLTYLQWHPLVLSSSFVILTIPALWTQHRKLNRLSEFQFAEKSDLRTSDTLDPTLHFLNWQMSVSKQKGLFFTFFLLPEYSLSWIICQAAHQSSFSYWMSAAAFASGIFITWHIGMNLCTRFYWLDELNPFSVMWHSWSFDRVFSKDFLADS